MTKKDCLKNAWAVMLLMVMGIAVSSCSNDDEPAILEGVKADASSFALNEAGQATVEFTVSPADASVDNVTLVGTDAFELVGKTSAGNGKWTVSLKATDFSKVSVANAVTLQVAQAGGAQKEITVDVEDPYSIEGKFALEHPRAFNYYGIGKDHQYETGLPVIVTAENGGDLTAISSIKIVNGVTSQKVGVDYFAAVKLPDGLTGVQLKVNPEKLTELKSLVPTFTTLELGAVLTSNKGRVARLLISAMACAPEGTSVVDDQLSATSVEIINPKFSKTATIDVTSKLKHIGVLTLDLKGAGDILIEEIGLFNEAGEAVEEESFLPNYSTDSNGNMICEFSMYGSDKDILQPGTYTYVQRFHVNYNYGGVKFQTGCSDLKYQVVIK